MKGIVSSKTMAGKIKAMGARISNVHLRGKGRLLVLTNDSKRETVEVTPTAKENVFDEFLEYPKIQWDWALDILAKAEDQPVVLDISGSKMDIIFTV